MELTQLSQSFVQHFGEMSSRWGVNRTVGQIYAVLMITEQPMNADQIGETLGLSRSNVSMSLKELHAWNLLTPVSIPGDRKDYFSTPDDVWEIARILIEERRKREMDPTLSRLRNVLLQEPCNESDEYALVRIREMHDIMDLMAVWVNEMQTLSSDRLHKLFKLGASVNKFLDMTDRLTGKGDKN